MSKKIIALLTFVCLLITSFPFIGVASAAPGPTLVMDVSNNWISGSGFDPSANLSVRIYSGSTLRASQQVGNDNGNFDTDWWNADWQDSDSSRRIELGNTVRVLENGTIVKNADIEQLSASIDKLSNTISVDGLSDSPVDVGVFENGPWPKDEVVNRPATTDSDGNFTFYFNDDTNYPSYPLSEENEAYVWVEDNNGDRTQIWVGSPALEVDVSNNNINGKYFPADTDVDLKLNGDGQLEATTNSVGQFNIDWREEGNDSLNQMAAGDSFTASFDYGGDTVVKSLEFEPVSATINWDGDDAIYGNAPDKTKIQTAVQNDDWNDSVWRNDMSDSSGGYTTWYSLKNPDAQDPEADTRYDLTKRDEVSVRYYKKDTLDTVQYWFGEPRLSVNKTHNWIEGRYLPRNRNNLRLEVTGNEPITNLSTDSSGFFNQNWWDINEEKALQTDDEIKVIDPQDNNKVLQSMTVSNLSVEPDYANGYVRGNKDVDTKVSADTDGRYGEDVKTGSRYDIDLNNINKNDNIWIENYDSEELNKTIVVKDPTRLRVNLTHQWFEGEGLTPGEVDIEITPTGDSKIVLNNQTVDFGGRLHIDNWQVREILGDDSDFNFSGADFLKVIDPYSTTDMTAASPLTAKVNTGTNSVSGSSPSANSNIRINVNDMTNDWEQVYERDLGSLSGSYDHTFEDGFQIEPKHAVTVTNADDDSNETLVVGAIPRLSVSNYRDLEGSYFQPGTYEVKVDGNTKLTKTVRIDGFFNNDGEGPDPVDLGLDAGKRIEVFKGSDEIIDWTLPALTGDIDIQNKKVTGTATSNDNVTVQRSDDAPKTVSVIDGSYEASFNDLSRNDWIYVSQQNTDGNSLNLNFSSPRLQAEIPKNSSSDSTISGEDFGLGNYVLEVKDSFGNPKGEGSKEITMEPGWNNRGKFDESGWFGTVAAGDNIVLRNTPQDGGAVIVSMTVAGFNSWFQNNQDDSITGSLTRGQYIQIGVTINPNFQPWNQDFEAWGEGEVAPDNSFNIPIRKNGSDELYDLGPDAAYAWVTINEDANNTFYKKDINDEVPTDFSFSAQDNVPLSSSRESNEITVSGVSGNVPISISGNGGQYSINGGTWATAGTVKDGDKVKVRQTSSSGYSDTKNTTLTIGAKSATFTVTTVGPPPPQTGGGNSGGQTVTPAPPAPAPPAVNNKGLKNALNKKISALKKKLAKLNKQIKGHKKKLKKSNAKQKKAIKKKISSINKQISAIKKKISVLNKQLKALK